ncbi:MAG: hypothetical protein MJZ49_00650 [Bacteroidales bacterium]|nr:hypothetical protein [Bacteroidales bacterium]
MEQEEPNKPEKKSFLKSWKTLKWHSKIYQIFIHGFALCGMAAIGAWAIYTMGLTNDKGYEDPYNRYLANYKQGGVTDSAKIYSNNLQNYIKLVSLDKVYSTNAHLIYEATQGTNDPDLVNRMLYACDMYVQESERGKNYQKMLDDINQVFSRYKLTATTENAIPWMNDAGWTVLKRALARDAKNIQKAAEITGVDARLIAACTVGEQIRLFNSKREDAKRRLGFMTMSVQSQFSLGVNGIKDFTAAAVERNLKDSTSVYYMGKKYEHILDFPEGDSVDIATARFNRLVDYHNNLYSFIYTGCILHQTMLQWKRAGYDISHRPDILCTLFNLGFQASKPNAEPRCGGSRVSVGGRNYTFGVLGNDFFYSGELSKEFPMSATLFQD